MKNTMGLYAMDTDSSASLGGQAELGGEYVTLMLYPYAMRTEMTTFAAARSKCRISVSMFRWVPWFWETESLINTNLSYKSILVGR
jgi:hypothetical protein